MVGLKKTIYIYIYMSTRAGQDTKEDEDGRRGKERRKRRMTGIK